jgi:hypothetical protein
MTDRFMAMLALPQPANYSFEALRDAIVAVAGSYPLTVKRLDEQPKSSPAGLVHLIAVNDVPITILLIDRPIPLSELETPLTNNIVWREARKRMATHRAHAIVAPLRAHKTHPEALDSAGSVTFVSAALSKLADAIGIYWPSAQTIIEGRAFERQAAGLGAGKIPIDVWVNLSILNGGRSPAGEQQVAIMTTGLKIFIGREIEFLPTPLPPVAVAQRVIGTAEYLIVNGLIVNDGDTIGVSPSERIRVRFADRGQRPDVPVLRLAVEKLDMATAEPR